MTTFRSLQKARDFIRAQGGEVSPLAISEEELNPEAQDEFVMASIPS